MSQDLPAYVHVVSLGTQGTRSMYNCIIHANLNAYVHADSSAYVHANAYVAAPATFPGTGGSREPPVPDCVFEQL